MYPVTSLFFLKDKSFFYVLKLQQKELARLGGTDVRKVNVRLITAANIDIRDLVKLLGGPRLIDDGSYFYKKIKRKITIKCC